MISDPDRDYDELPAAPRNLRAVIQYDGSRHAGWERQSNGVGIQQEVEDAIFRVTGERTLVNGSGRTDAGVHAVGQTASFVLAHSIPTSDLERALNAVLPAEIAVTALDEVDLHFHARFSALSKTYRYLVIEGRAGAPLLRHAAHHVRRRLDVEAMHLAARSLLGRHDFRAFCREPDRVDDTLRTIHAIDVRRDGRLIAFDVAGDGFLYNMVRIIVGTLLEVGTGRRSVEAVAATLASRDRKRAGATVPACGLCLLGVSYERYEEGSDDDRSVAIGRSLV